MASYLDLTREEIEVRFEECRRQYDHFKSLGLRLDMSRGRPGSDQLDLSSGLLECLTERDYFAEDGADCRNYGGLDGISEMKRLFGDLLGARPDEVLVGGNSSLSLMFMCVSLLFGNAGGRKFLCPSPGYDRHFTICEHFGIEMIPIDMTPDGPDMAQVRRRAADPAVAGMWCVPVFSNPQGYVYSDETILELAALDFAAPDFRILWDNAYAVHQFEGEPLKPLNILRACQEKGVYDKVIMFTSFSKISFAGSGVAALAASPNNLEKIRSHMAVSTLGPDKINQLRHVRFFKDANGVHKHMKKHAALLRPKFDLVERQLTESLSGKGIAHWHRPRGGYFVPFDTLPGCAKRTVALCKEAGLTMTPAGATYPHGHDPQDRNIRIAPSAPQIAQLQEAMKLFCLAVELAALEKIMDSM